MAGDFTLVQITHDGVWAVRGGASPAGASLEQWVRGAPPSGQSAEAASVGAWLGQVFDEHKLPRGRVIVCVPRADVVVKVISLPPASGNDDADLPSMVRLQMIRQLTLPSEGTAIDFVQLPDDAAGQRRVLAAALPADRLAWLQGVAQAAGFKIRHIALTSAGLAAGVAEIGQRREGAVLALAGFGQSVEMVIVENGVMTLSRSIEVYGMGEAPDALAIDRLAIECQRTWASHAGSGAPACVACLGDGPEWAALAERCGRAMDTTGLALNKVEGVRADKSLQGAEASWVLPLGGVLLAKGLGRPMLDFANPRRAPDLSARTRQMVLMGMMLLVLAGVALYIVADRKLRGLREDLRNVQNAQADLAAKVADFRVLHARVSDLEAWTHASPDWVAHLASVSAKLPDPGVAQLSQVSGAATGAAVFTPKGSYPGGAWDDRVQVVLGLDGKMEDRGPIAQLRESLLAMGDYTVISKGADVPASFSLELSTGQRAPAQAATSEAGPEGSHAAPPSKPAPKSAPKAGAKPAPKKTKGGG